MQPAIGPQDSRAELHGGKYSRTEVGRTKNLGWAVNGKQMNHHHRALEVLLGKRSSGLHVIFDVLPLTVSYGVLNDLTSLAIKT
jgi:hypothetical protein